MERKLRNILPLVFLYLLTSLLSVTIAYAETALPKTIAIADFGAPAKVYACKYFFLNATINDSDGTNDFVNATVEISNSIILKWDNSTNTFGLYWDMNNYCTLDSAGSVRTELNSTAYKLSFRIKLGWSYPEGYVSMIAANTKVYDSAGANGSGSASNLFYFEDDLIVYSAGVDDSRVNLGQNVPFAGTVYYEGTTTPPGTGSSALSFNGVDDYMEAPDSVNLSSIKTELTLNYWVKRVADDGGYNVLKQDAFGGLEDIGGNSFIFWTSHIGGEDGFRFTTDKISLDVWHHIVAIWTPGNKKVYIDGVLVAEKTNSRTDDLNQHSTFPIYIGNSRDWYRYNFTGVIDEVRIYNRALSQVEIQDLYNGVNIDDGLVLYLPFDGDTEDYSGQGNHGTLYGPTWVTGKKVKVDTNVELGGTLKKSIGVIEADGTFSIPSVTAESTVGSYSYNIYTYTDQASIQNKTINVVVERPKWYEPVVKWLLSLNPLIWGVVSTIIILTILLSLEIIKIELEKSTEITAVIKNGYF